MFSVACELYLRVKKLLLTNSASVYKYREVHIYYEMLI